MRSSTESIRRSLSAALLRRTGQSSRSWLSWHSRRKGQHQPGVPFDPRRPPPVTSSDRTHDARQHGELPAQRLVYDGHLRGPGLAGRRPGIDVQVAVSIAGALSVPLIVRTRQARMHESYDLKRRRVIAVSHTPHSYGHVLSGTSRCALGTRLPECASRTRSLMLRVPEEPLATLCHTGPRLPQ
jgi:hypothetical protein